MAERQSNRWIRDLRRSLTPFLLLLAAAGPSPSFTNGTFSGTIGVTGAATLSGGGALTGSFAGGTFTGTTLTTPTVNGGALSGTFTGAHTYSGATTLSGGGTLSGTFAGTPTWSGLNTFSNGLTVGSNVGTSSNLVINGALANQPRLELWTAGALQWRLGVSSSNDLILTRFLSGTGSSAFAVNNATGALSVPQAFSGTPSCSSNCFDNIWNVSSDTRAATSNFDYWHHQATYGGGSTDGSRTGGVFIVLQNGDVTGTHAGVSAALGSQMNINGSAGGSAGNYKGGYTAFNPGCILQAATHFISGCTGGEVNFTARTGSSYFAFTGWQFILESDHAVRGDGHIDSGFVIAAQTGASAGLDYGMRFGNNSSGQNPFNTTATIIQATLSQNDGSLPLSVARGLDFLAPTFSGSAFRSRGFRVDGGTASGSTVNIGTTQIVAGASSTTYDTTGAVATATTLNAGGAGWAVGDLFEIGVDGLGLVNTITGGAVATYTVKRLPYDFSGSPPATLTAVALAPSGGSALVLNVTWNSSVKTMNLGTAAATAINIGNAAANVLLGGGSALATNATIGFPLIPSSAGTPTGTVAGAAAGKVAIQIDTTNKKLCYSVGGGTWECSAAFTP